MQYFCANFLSNMKRTYYIPTIEITVIGSYLMQMATGSDKGDYGGAPERREKAF